jgi:hypothetical protein
LPAIKKVRRNKKDKVFTSLLRLKEKLLGGLAMMQLYLVKEI